MRVLTVFVVVVGVAVAGAGCTTDARLPDYDPTLIERSTGVVATAPWGRFNVSVAAVPSGFFRDELWTPSLGRLFVEGDHVASSRPTVVLSYGFWEQLGAEHSLIGSSIDVGGTRRTMIGVLPHGSSATADVHLWIPR